MNNRNEAVWKYVSIALMAVIVVLLLFTLAALTKVQRVTGTPPNFAQSAALKTSPSQLEVETPDNIYWVANLVEKALPFVVHVRTRTIPQKSGEESPGGGPFKELPNNGGNNDSNNQSDIWKRFHQQFPWFDFQVPDTPQDYGQIPQEGVGSGFIVSPDGYLVTNAHVVDKMEGFTVMLNDGTEYDANLVGTDNLKDIAVLKISAKNLPTAVLGDSDKVRIGEPAIAIGSPFGLEATVTEGIVSTTARDPSELSMPSDVRRVRTLIQTDASINQGNSGGPLLNAKGEVIGVNQAILPYGRGIGFAIPINEVKGSIDQIIKRGKVAYPGIGVYVQDVTKDYMEELKVEVDHGAYVRQVNAGGAADKAGIQPGDVVLEIEGVKINGADDLITEIQKYDIGVKVTVLVARKGLKSNMKKVSVILDELDTSEFTPGR
jgi:serine protease Do